MREVLRLAIVDPSEATREPLRNLLMGLESVWLEAECARYEFFFDVIHQSELDVAVISLDADQPKALQLIAQVALERPQLPILAVSGKGDGNCILQALRSGAKEFLTQPVVLEELLTALKRLQLNRAVSESHQGATLAKKQETTIIAVIGSSGGVGCTSLAVNLGACLAQVPENSVALIDLDLALGDADVALDLMADYTLADVALNIDRLDMTFLRRSLSKHSSGLSLLPHPVQMEDASLIREEHVQRVLGLLRSSYSHLILDLSKGFTSTDITSLRMSDVILVVAQLDLSCLRNVVRMMLTLQSEEGLAEKVKIVLNRVGTECDISIKKAEETIGKPIFWQIPNDPKAMIESRNAGAPLLQHAPKCKAQQSISGLAATFAGKEELTQTPKPKAGGWRGMFSGK
ncbi:MAG TPA: AAA family ATPase [Gemmataceae bacterium]|jgi:pilus assembly protein CpaE|nr:AAA family ATPase [Gemmataceae bacterium]